MYVSYDYCILTMCIYIVEFDEFKIVEKTPAV